MKKFFFILIICQFLPFSFVKGQDVFDDSTVFAEREYFYRKYRSIRDTMKINTWLNLKRVSDNLEQVVKRDMQVIEALRKKASADSLVIVNLNDVVRQYNKLVLRHDELKSKSEAEELMILYLKAAVGLILLLILIFIFLFISSAGKVRKYRNLSDNYESLAEERQHHLDSLDADLRKQKAREFEFREELERGVKTYQERLFALQEKSNELITQNQQLREAVDSGGQFYTPSNAEGMMKLDIPENVDELKNMVKSLYDERNSLMNLAGKLRMQTEEENRKNREIITKINLLAQDLSGNQGIQL